MTTAVSDLPKNGHSLLTARSVGLYHTPVKQISPTKDKPPCQKTKFWYCWEWSQARSDSPKPHLANCCSWPVINWVYLRGTEMSTAMTASGAGCTGSSSTVIHEWQYILHGSIWYLSWSVSYRCQAMMDTCDGHSQFWSWSFSSWPHVNISGWGNH